MNLEKCLLFSFSAQASPGVSNVSGPCSCSCSWVPVHAGGSETLSCWLCSIPIHLTQHAGGERHLWRCCQCCKLSVITASGVTLLSLITAGGRRNLHSQVVLWRRFDQTAGTSSATIQRSNENRRVLLSYHSLSLSLLPCLSVPVVRGSLWGLQASHSNIPPQAATSQYGIHLQQDGRVHATSNWQRRETSAFSGLTSVSASTESCLEMLMTKSLFIKRTL